MAVSRPGPGKAQASPGDVDGFLIRFRAAMQANGLTIWNARKNTDFMLEHGFIDADVEAAILDLRHYHYNSGPMDDDDARRANGQVWVFHTEYAGIPIYLKLKLVGPAHTPGETACLSFHEPEREMKTPMKTVRRVPSRAAKRGGRR